jgi:hypothetical protein
MCFGASEPSPKFGAVPLEPPRRRNPSGSSPLQQFEKNLTRRNRKGQPKLPYMNQSELDRSLPATVAGHCAAESAEAPKNERGRFRNRLNGKRPT